jgi:hypothetical protein
LPHGTGIEAWPPTLLVPALGKPVRPRSIDPLPPVDDPVPAVVALPESPPDDERTTPPQAESTSTTHPISHRSRTPPA